MKKNLLKLKLLSCILLLSNQLHAQVNVSGSTAADGAYTTLGAAFTAINGTAQTGNSIVISLTAGTTETATATLTAGAWTSINITATVPVVITGSIGGAIIRLNGADFVTIDGRITGVGRNITINNTSTTTGSAAIWLSSAGVGAGATDNTIRNLEISCGATQNTSTNNTFGIIMCGTTISATSNGDDNDNNTFTENRITRCKYGIVTRGATTNNNQNIMVTNNIVGPTSFGADEIGKVGIFMQADNLSVVSGNTVQFVGGDYSNTSAGADRMGIAIGNESWSNAPGTITSSNYLVSNNIVHDIIEERTFSAIGINMATTNGGAPTNNIVSNNMIYNVKANGTAGDALVGLGIAGGFGDQIIHNSIYLYGDVDPNAAATATSMYGSGIRIANASGATHANLTLKFNIVHMDLSSSSTPAARYYAITGNAAGYSFGTGGQDFNDYYLNPVNIQLMTGGLGTASGNTLGTQFTALLNWKTAYTVNQDAGSYQADPSYTSTTNLHIPAGTTSFLESGATGSSLTLDIDGDSRPGPAGSVNGGATAPDVGADEFDGIPIANCSGTPASSVSLSTAASVCSGVNFTLSLDINYAELGYTFQWQSSPDNVLYTNISGATATTYLTNQSSATYYQCIITCTNSGLSTTSTPIMVNLNLPTACYCTPTFPSAVEPITLVDFAGISNTTSNTVNGTPALEDFTSLTGNVMEGQTYPISLKGNTAGNFTTYLSVYIDFNQNGNLNDAGETFNIGTIINSTGIDAITLTGNITIPMGATAGNTRMRVVKKYNANGLPCNNAGYGQAEDYTLNITLAPTCSGTPTAGTITPVSSGICSGVNFTLDLNGQSTDNNITIQWESSVDGITYLPISGATADSYSTSITSSTYFQCVVTCTPSGMSATAAAVFLTINPFTSCYCTTAYPSNVEPITRVSFAGINNSSSNVLNGTPAQENFQSMVASAERGHTYPIALKGNTDGNFTDNFSVFFDFNQDGDFLDVGEGFNLGTITNSTGVDAVLLTGNITIPITATLGITGMRIVKHWNGYVGACNITGFGQTEDYLIDILPCTPPSSITLNSNDADATICNGTSVLFTAPTGYTYYDFQINSSSVQTGAGITYSSSALISSDAVIVNAGYDVTCATASNTFTFTVNPLPSATLISVDPACAGVDNGSIDLSVTGGTLPFAYEWDNDGTGDNDDNEDLSALGDGTYIIVVTDANGCIDTDNAILNYTTTVNTIVSSTDASCFGFLNGTISQTVSGGSSPYNYDWDNDGTGDNDDTEDLNSLAAGTYTGIVYDVNGCMDQNTVVIDEPTEIVINAVNTNATCFGYSDATSDVTVTGGAGGYIYDWSMDGIGDNDDAEDVSGTTASNIFLVVTDIFGCSSLENIILSEPDIIAVSSISTDISCFGDANGSIDLSVSGGTNPYSIDWDNDGTGDFDDVEDLSSLDAGTFIVEVTDDNGCPSATTSVTIDEPLILGVSPLVTNANCSNSADGEIDVTVTGGTNPYGFSWSGGETTEDLTSLAEGSYTITVTDDNGCMEMSIITVGSDNIAPIVSLIVNPSTTCNTDGAITLGGESPLGGVWSGTGVTGSSFNPATAGVGTYTITYIFTDGNGCSNSAQDDIQVDDCSGISENEKESFRVYPNPTIGLITIVPGDASGIIIIRDAIGKVVYTSACTSDKVMVDMTAFSRGMYSISLEASNGTQVQKLIKD